MAEFYGKLYPHQEDLVNRALAHEAVGHVKDDKRIIISNTIVVTGPRGCGKKTAIVALIVRREIPPARPWNVHGSVNGCILARGGQFWRQNVIITSTPAGKWIGLFNKYAPWLRVMAVCDSKSMRNFCEHVAAGTIAHADIIVVRAAEYTYNHKRSQIVDDFAKTAAGAVFARVIYTSNITGNIRLLASLRNIFIGFPPTRTSSSNGSTITTPFICDINDDQNIKKWFTIAISPALAIPPILCYRVTRVNKTAALTMLANSFGAEPGVNPAVALAGVWPAHGKSSCEICAESISISTKICCGIIVCGHCATAKCPFCAATGTSIHMSGHRSRHGILRPLHDTASAVSSIISGETPPGATRTTVKLGEIMNCNTGVLVPPPCKKVLIAAPSPVAGIPEMRGSAADRARLVDEFRATGAALVASPQDCANYDFSFVTDIIVCDRQKDTLVQFLGGTQRIGRTYSVTLWLIDHQTDMISLVA